jgi:hypothetical protein
MTAWARKKLEELERIDLCGYICKKDSPSSGMERVKVYGDSGIPAKVGSGIFTKAFMEHFPLIPVEEEGRLNDPTLREMFIGRVFTLRRFRDLLAQGIPSTPTTSSSCCPMTGNGIRRWAGWSLPRRSLPLPTCTNNTRNSSWRRCPRSPR